MKSDLHSPQMCLRRAAKDIVKAGGKPSCPGCNKPYEDAAGLMKHIKKHHNRALTGIEVEAGSPNKKTRRTRKAAVAEDEDAVAEARGAEEAEASNPTKRTRSSRYVVESDEDEDMHDAEPAKEPEEDFNLAEPAYTGKGKGRA